MKTTKIIFFLFICFSFKALAEPPAWELVSMNPPRGSVKGSDTSEGLIFLYGSNIYYSTNNGDSWIWTGVDDCFNMIFTNNYLLYSKRINYPGPGKIFKSSDFGSSWVECMNGIIEGHHVFAKNENLIVSIVKDENYLYNCYLTSDYGENWIFRGKIEEAPRQTAPYMNLIFFKNFLLTWGRAETKPIGSNIKISLDTGITWLNFYFPYFEIGNFYFNNLNEIYCSGKKGIWLSEDTCKTWNVKFFIEESVSDFFIRENKSTLVASVSKKGIYYSNDSGKTWEQSEEFKNYPNGINSALLFSQNENIFCYPIYLAPFRSSDYGKTWEEVSNGFSAAPPYDFVINPFGEMYISHLGIFKSTNEGRKFNFQGLRDVCFGPLAFNSKGYIYAGMDWYNFSDNQGIYRSKDGGKNWDYKRLNSTGINAIVVDGKNYIYASINAGGLSRSTDDGETWSYIGDPSPGGGYLGVNDEGHVFSFSTGHITRTTDNGDTWVELAYTQVDPTYIEWGCRIIFNNKTKTAAYYDLMTTDNGRTWFKQNSSGYSFGTTGTDEFAVDSSYSWIYSGIYPAILRSTDNGKTWHVIDTTGLKHSEYTRPAVSPDGHIYVFGSTGGLYRSRDKFVSVEEDKPNEKMFISNYPNPATNKTQVTINIKKSGELLLSVFDALGKLCGTINYGIIESGETNILLDTENYPPGTYNYKIQCGGEVQSHSFIIVK